MSDRLVTVARFRDLPQALVSLGKLESAGIEAELADDNMVRMDWRYSNFIGGIRLQVSQDQQQDAQAVLNAPLDPVMEMETTDGLEHFEQPRCPRCGSLNIEEHPSGQALTYFALFAMSIPIPLGKGDWHCSDCDARWENVPDKAEEAFAGGADEDAAPALYAATTNKGKLQEFREIASINGMDVLPVPNQENIPEVVEDGKTFEANAAKKAIEYSRYVHGAVVFADDSGLEVAALGGAPGVHSARYAARSATDKPRDSDNNYKLLAALRDAPTGDRSARFVCVIAAARDGITLGTFRGEAQGEIIASPLGKHGFGYDPLFFVVEANKTFAEMSATEKSHYSHRGAAFRKFLEWLSQES